MTCCNISMSLLHGSAGIESFKRFPTNACHPLQVFNLPPIKQLVDRLPAETRAQTLEGIQLAVLLHEVSGLMPCTEYYVCWQACCTSASCSTQPSPFQEQPCCVSQRPGFVRQSTAQCCVLHSILMYLSATTACGGTRAPQATSWPGCRRPRMAWCLIQTARAF